MPQSSLIETAEMVFLYFPVNVFFNFIFIYSSGDESLFSHLKEISYRTNVILDGIDVYLLKGKFPFKNRNYIFDGPLLDLITANIEKYVNANIFTIKKKFILLIICYLSFNIKYNTRK
jgi:hypothetical protein